MTRSEFYLEDGEVYLNCGTLGATPRVVLSSIFEEIRREERNPTRQIGQVWMNDRVWDLHARLALRFGCDPAGFILCQNVTAAMNIALFGLDLPAGSEILVSDLEYGAVVHAAREAARRKGWQIRTFTAPKVSAESLRDTLIGQLTHDTRALLLSHVTSIHGLRWPVEEIVPELHDKAHYSLDRRRSRSRSFAYKLRTPRPCCVWRKSSQMVPRTQRHRFPLRRAFTPREIGPAACGLGRHAF